MPLREELHRQAIIKGRVVAMCGLDEIVRLLEQEGDVAAVLRQKMDRAAVHKEPAYTPPI